MSALEQLTRLKNILDFWGYSTHFKDESLVVSNHPGVSVSVVWAKGFYIVDRVKGVPEDSGLPTTGWQPIFADASLHSSEVDAASSVLHRLAYTPALALARNTAAVRIFNEAYFRLKDKMKLRGCTVEDKDFARVGVGVTNTDRVSHLVCIRGDFQVILMFHHNSVGGLTRISISGPRGSCGYNDLVDPKKLDEIADEAEAHLKGFHVSTANE